MAATTPRKSLTIPAPLIKRMKKLAGRTLMRDGVRIRTTQVTADDYKKAFEGWLEQGLDVLSISDPSLDGLFSVLFPPSAPAGRRIGVSPFVSVPFLFRFLEKPQGRFFGHFPFCRPEQTAEERENKLFTARLR